jgi:hypothetical protein
MPLRNRVTPLGELTPTCERGLVYGNRGCLHDERGQIRRSYAVKRWIACQLEFRGRRRLRLMAPGRYTELFFLDEATALAAGHRPCAECRRSDYTCLTRVWADLHPGQNGADAIDAQLHAERIDPRTGERRLYDAQFDELPDGVFVMQGDKPCLVHGSRLLTWTPAGYLGPGQQPANERAVVITPPSLVALLRSGWTPIVPLLHHSAGGPRRGEPRTGDAPA